MSAGKRACLWFGLLVIFSLLLQLLGFLFGQIPGEAGALFYLLHLYLVLPLGAIIFPFLAGKRGVHPLAAFFPVGGCLLLLPVYHSPGVGLLCLLLSLVASVAAQEWEKQKNHKKGSHHGTAKRKK
ncbi:MAG: hypothetical protein IJE17_06450 [Clostridia bacterium]|nr:hypothetical protein [Clostridiales bacterium]MBQ2977111.1 hypothetical protein [Clostridia bacterium]MBQ6805781.1 hypothetical protein [Clostridia bacterium]MDD6683424.1 hypothetical protein [Clostridiales bacterium]